MTLQRNTPIKRGKPLRSVSPKREEEAREAGVVLVSTFGPRGEWLSLDRKSRASSRQAPKAANEFPKSVVDLALERDLNACARCGRGVGPGRGVFWSAQHRRARQGLMLPDTNAVANCIVLCGSATSPHCHYEVEQRGEVERVRGYWFRQIADGKPTDPTTVPLKHAAHGWVLLDQRGGYERCDAPAEVAT